MLSSSIFKSESNAYAPQTAAPHQIPGIPSRRIPAGQPSQRVEGMLQGISRRLETIEMNIVRQPNVVYAPSLFARVRPLV